MKTMAICLIVTLGSVFAMGQRRLAEDDSQWRRQAVRRAFDEVAAGMHSSWSDKYLARLGDSAAPEIMSLVASKPVTKREAEIALTLVRMSFANPDLIRHTQHKTPTNSYILLDYLDKHTSDADTGSRIRLMREQLRGQSLGTESRPNN